MTTLESSPIGPAMVAPSGFLPTIPRPEPTNEINFPIGNPIVVRHLPPYAKLIEFPPLCTTKAHFHPVDQFQVFFGASGGWYQRSALTSPVLHYSDAYTTYGPFGTTDKSMKFYTLRREASTLTGFMPGARDKLIRGRGRHFYVELDSYLDQPIDRDDAAVVPLIRQEDDGLSSDLVVLGKGAHTSILASAPFGRYVCVLRGELREGDQNFGPKSLGWHAGGGPLFLQASEHSECAVLVLTFGRSLSGIPT